MSSMVKRVTKKSSKAKSSMVRRYKTPRLPTDQTVYRFLRTGSSNANATNALPIQIKTNSLTGRPEFSTGLTSSTELSMLFSLSTIDIYLNGLLSSSFDIPLTADFRNLFDEYKIEKIDIMVLPTYANNGVVLGASAAQLPWIVHCVDTTDVDGENSLELMQHQDAKMTQLTYLAQNAPYLRSFRPKVRDTLDGSGTNSGIVPAPWIACTSFGTPHYGFKMALDDSYNGYTANQTVAQLNIICRYHLAFKGLK